MALLNSKFDIVSVDNVISPAALAQVLAVGTLMPSPTVGSSGTPVAGTIPAGAIVMMSATGKAELATSPLCGSAAPTLTASKLLFVTIDGDMDYSGAFVHKISVLAGGLTFKTDQYEGAVFSPGDELYANNGKVKLKVVNDGRQRVGYVGPNGYDAINGVLEVIMPQGLI